VTSSKSINIRDIFLETDNFKKPFFSKKSEKKKVTLLFLKTFF